MRELEVLNKQANPSLAKNQSNLETGEKNKEVIKKPAAGKSGTEGPAIDQKLTSKD